MSNIMISEKLKDFVNKNLNSWNEVQILAYFFNNPDQEYSPEIIAEKLNGDEQLISDSLKHLSTQNLLSEKKSGEKTSYLYNQTDEETGSVIKLLSLTHKAQQKPIMKIINKKLEASEKDENPLKNTENPKSFGSKFNNERTKKFGGADNKHTTTFHRRSV